MKKVLLLIAGLAMACIMHAQEITVSEVVHQLGGSNNPSFALEVPGVSKKELAEGWKKYLSAFHATTKESKGELNAENVNMTQLSNEPISVYSTIVGSKKENPKLIVAFKTTAGFVNSAVNSEQASKAKEMLKNMAVNLAKSRVAEDEAKVQKALSKEEKKVKKLEDEISKKNKAISKNKSKIEKLKDKTPKDNVKATERDADVAALEKKNADLKLEIAQLEVKLNEQKTIVSQKQAELEGLGKKKSGIN